MGKKLVFVFGTLLGPEATGPWRGVRGLFGLRVFCRGFGCFWFPGCMVRALMAVPVFGGGWCGGCGTGLLFENYIVDASS